MSIATEISKLTHDAIIELFVIDATALGGSVMYLHAGTNQLSQPVVWQGQAYDPFPIQAEGFERNSSGPFPRPTLKVSNVYGLVGALVRDYKGLKGAKVTRRRTLAKYLDAVNFEGGVNPSADPSAHYPDDVWYIDRRAASDHSVVAFELASPMDVAGVMIPRRQVLAGVCVWAYRGPDCGYTGGAVAKEDDTPTGLMSEDACGHRPASCRLRTWPNNELPISAFLGAGSIQAL
jgi:lambda family phage minor tail protein L